MCGRVVTHRLSWSLCTDLGFTVCALSFLGLTPPSSSSHCPGHLFSRARNLPTFHWCFSWPMTHHSCNFPSGKAGKMGIFPPAYCSLWVSTLLKYFLAFVHSKELSSWFNVFPSPTQHIQLLSVEDKFVTRSKIVLYGFFYFIVLYNSFWIKFFF